MTIFLRRGPHTRQQAVDLRAEQGAGFLPIGLGDPGGELGQLPLPALPSFGAVGVPSDAANAQQPADKRCDTLRHKGGARARPFAE